MKVWTYVFALLFTVLLFTSCSISTKSRREADLKAARTAGFIAGCIDAANGVAGQFGVGFDPEKLAKICSDQAAK